MTFNPRDPHFVKALVSNVEEGLVLTAGLLAGIAIAGISQTTIVLVGMIFVFTGGIAAASRYKLSHQNHPEYGASSTTACIMIGLLYIVAALVPILPYMVLPVSSGFTSSIVCSFAVAFIIGIWSGHTGSAVWKSAWHLAYVAAAGAIIGAIVHAVL